MEKIAKFRAYDYDKVMNIIEEHRDQILEACLGLKDDWFTTGLTIYENDNYTLNLTTKPDINGLYGCYDYDDIPILWLTFKNNVDERIECFIEIDDETFLKDYYKSETVDEDFVNKAYDLITNNKI